MQLYRMMMCERIVRIRKAKYQYKFIRKEVFDYKKDKLKLF